MKPTLKRFETRRCLVAIQCTTGKADTFTFGSCENETFTSVSCRRRHVISRIAHDILDKFIFSDCIFSKSNKASPKIPGSNFFASNISVRSARSVYSSLKYCTEVISEATLPDMVDSFIEWEWSFLILSSSRCCHCTPFAFSSDVPVK